MKTRVTVLCNNPDHPIFPRLKHWATCMNECDSVDVELVQSLSELTSGDLLFLVSCSEMVGPSHQEAYRHSLVLHASDLPEGRGWSPHVWQVLEGRDRLTVSLLEAREPVDTGEIWRKIIIKLDGTELYDDINERLFDAELALMDWAVEHFDDVAPQPQSGTASYYPRRTPADSELDPTQTLEDLMPLLRVCDPHRFPAFFYYRGQKYRLSIEKVNDS